MTFDKSDSQAMKGIAILMMLFHHCYFTKDRFEQYDVDFFPLGMVKAMDIAAFFKICVAIFVFISGYGIMVSMQKCGDSRLAVRKNVAGRYISLMMGYWFVYALSLIAVAAIKPSMFSVYNVKGNAGDYILNLLLDALGLSNLFGTPTLNSTWWYMSFALIVVAVVPIFIEIYKRYGAITLLVICFFLRYVYALDNFDMTRYFPILALGIICADRNYLGRIKQKKWVKIGFFDYLFKLIVYSAVFYLMYYIRIRNRIDGNITEVRDGIVPLYVIFYCYTILFPIKPLKKFLEFMGKHSMNIFLTHTFIRFYFFGDFIYSFKNAYLITLVLWATSLALALAIYGLQKLVRFDKLTAKLKQWVCDRIEGKTEEKTEEPQAVSQ